MTDVGQTRLTDFSPRSMGNVDDEHPENDYDGPAFAEVDPSGRYGRVSRPYPFVREQLVFHFQCLLQPLD